jgi:hypothetical protein
LSNRERRRCHEGGDDEWADRMAHEGYDSDFALAPR